MLEPGTAGLSVAIAVHGEATGMLAAHCKHTCVTATDAAHLPYMFGGARRGTSATSLAAWYWAWRQPHRQYTSLCSLSWWVSPRQAFVAVTHLKHSIFLKLQLLGSLPTAPEQAQHASP
jgi:hypothetical protein